MVSIDADNGGDGASLDLPDAGDSPERALLRAERARTLHDAIRELPDRLDEVVERNFFGDESLTDIARDLGVTLSRVSQMRARALTLLHAVMSELWEEQAVAPDGGVRARNQQRAYVDRVAAGRAGSRGRAAAPSAAPEAAEPTVPAPRTPVPRGSARPGWQLPDRTLRGGQAARPA
jgi:RNA polymerase sigma factor for flagellar operon FliA